MFSALKMSWTNHLHSKLSSSQLSKFLKSIFVTFARFFLLFPATSVVPVEIQKANWQVKNWRNFLVFMHEQKTKNIAHVHRKWLSSLYFWQLEFFWHRINLFAAQTTPHCSEIQKSYYFQLGRNFASFPNFSDFSQFCFQHQLSTAFSRYYNIKQNCKRP